MLPLAQLVEAEDHTRERTRLTAMLTKLSPRPRLSWHVNIMQRTVRKAGEIRSRSSEFCQPVDQAKISDRACVPSTTLTHRLSLTITTVQLQGYCVTSMVRNDRHDTSQAWQLQLCTYTLDVNDCPYIATRLPRTIKDGIVSSGKVFRNPGQPMQHESR